MKTVQQALIDDIHYPIAVGFVENALIRRGLDPTSECSSETINGKAYMGAVADSLVSLVAAPNISEADKSISLSDKDKILNWANRIYVQIGEPEASVDGSPMVYVGDCLL